MRDDILDVRDLIKRFEELEELEEIDDEEIEERNALRALLDELKGAGGDEQWRGDWFPITLIADSYFEQYAQELADDIGAVDSKASWPNDCIDWAKAARELQVDYTTVDYDGVTYWFR